MSSSESEEKKQRFFKTSLSENTKSEDNDNSSSVSNLENSEESSEENPKKISKRNWFRDSLFEDAADEDEEDEDELDEELSEEGFEKVQEDYLVRPKRNQFQQLLSGTELEERYRTKDYDDIIEEETTNLISYELQQQSLIPSVTDPKLWMVRCKIGQEKQTVVALMRKCIDLEFSEHPLQIKSCLSVDSLKGYIYVEAHKDSHVKSAIKGMASLQYGQWKQTLVPLEQMTDVLSCVKKTKLLEPHSWVRMKRTIYKDDLAQVLDCDENSMKCIIKLIPRLYSKKENNNQKRNKGRPIQKLFDPNTYALGALQTKIVLDHHCTVFENQKFDSNGFLIKTVHLRALITEGVQPTVEELRKFNYEDKDNFTGLVLDKCLSFFKGDRVKVIDGDLNGLIGTIDSQEGLTAYIIPKLDSLKGIIPVPFQQMIKYFENGDHIKVIKGIHSGKTGLITSISDQIVYVIGNHSNEEFEVFSRDISLSQDISSGSLKPKRFELYDMIDVDSHAVGVIIKIETDSFQVLTQQGEVRRVLEIEINSKKKFKNLNTIDANKNELRIGDPVRVIDGIYKEKQGVLKSIYREMLFIHSKEVLENGGIIVVRNRLVLSVGNKNSNQKIGYLSNSQFNQYSHGYRNATYKKTDSLRNSMAVITRGAHKGVKGIIKDSTNSTVRVELSSTSLIVTVNRDHIQLIDKKGVIVSQRGKNNDGNVSGPYGKNEYLSNTFKNQNFELHTPSYSSYASPYESKTSFHDSFTPTYGSQTPLYGSMTPHTPIEESELDDESEMNSFTRSTKKLVP